MKKFLAILLAICMMASMLCVPAFAAESANELPAPAEGTVIRVKATKGNGEVLIGDYADFEDGWNDAMGLAGDTGEMKKEGYDRVVVDFYSDWIAKGFFTDDWLNGDGFKNDTIYIPDDAKVTLNLRGHTINRGLTYLQLDGEVMYIDDGADVIINDGTITGGYSENGAGGIYIISDATVTLNNVHVIDNAADDDDGGGIALYSDSTLIMNGGSLQDNFVKNSTFSCYGGAIYSSDSNVVLKNVLIKDNKTLLDNSPGAAIYADNSTVSLIDCTVDGNGIKDEANKIYASISTIHAIESSISIKHSTFTNNGALYIDETKGINGEVNVSDFSSIIYLDESILSIEENSTFTGNNAYAIIRTRDDDEFFISDSTFTDNASGVLSSADHFDGSYFINCTFNNNKEPSPKSSYSFDVMENVLTFYDCKLGNSTFDKHDEKYIRIEHSTVLESEAVIGVTLNYADGTTSSTRYYKAFEGGWNYAMEAAVNSAYERVTVDLYADWSADEDDDFIETFLNGPGFKWRTIYIADDARITLNMNGHTIDRHVADAEEDGEVILIDTGANVIINDGTITGGHSDTGAGGLYIKSGANVTLNNVNVVGNISEDDDGAGIAVYGATLTMNGGSLENNLVYNEYMNFCHAYGALYMSDSTATLNGVKIAHNRIAGYHTSRGVVICIDDSTLTMKDCTVADNGRTESVDANSLIAVWGATSVLDITSCTFENNDDNGTAAFFDVVDGTLKMRDSAIINNMPAGIIFADDALIEVTNCRFEGNNGDVFSGVAVGESKFDSCTFSYNGKGGYDTFFFKEGNQLEFTNCEFGNSTFNDRSLATFNGQPGNAVGSIFGEGSLATIVALLALIASGVAIFLVVYYNKKKAVPVAANNAAEAEDEE